MKIRVQTPLGEVELCSRRLPDGRTIWSQVPHSSAQTPSEKQQEHRRRFREAIRYAQEAARTMPIYAELAAKSPMRTACNIATTDWFHPPEIVEVDLSGWTSRAGEPIRVQAVDDVQVKQVSVAITDEKDVVLEQGAATLGEGEWWLYRTTVPARGNPKVRVTAEDLPGNIAEVMKSRN
jgi:hypothetical protein